MSDESDIRIVPVGQKFEVDLEAMPGAGYLWEIGRHPKGIELVGQEVVRVSKKIGGPSTQRFILVAREPGDYSLDFQLKRRWEQEPVKTSEVTIQAK